MKYTNKELEHFETLARFFDFELFVDGEYPFYTDDRLMDEDGKVKKNVYKNGKRTSVNMLPTSIDSEKGQHALDLQQIKDATEQSSVHYNNSFMTFVIHNWDKHLTAKQQQFLVDTLNGQDGSYTKQHKFYFRQEIQKRLKTAFIGEFGVDIPHYKIGEYRTKVIMVESFLGTSDDNQQYQDLIIKHIDKEMVNKMIYTKMSCEGRKNIVQFYNGSVDRIEPKFLYEFHGLILDTKDILEDLRMIIQTEK